MVVNQLKVHPFQISGFRCQPAPLHRGRVQHGEGSANNDPRLESATRFQKCQPNEERLAFQIEPWLFSLRPCNTRALHKACEDGQIKVGRGARALGINHVITRSRLNQITKSLFASLLLRDSFRAIIFVGEETASVWCCSNRLSCSCGCNPTLREGIHQRRGRAVQA